MIRNKIIANIGWIDSAFRVINYEILYVKIWEVASVQISSVVASQNCLTLYVWLDSKVNKSFNICSLLKSILECVCFQLSEIIRDLLLLDQPKTLTTWPQKADLCSTPSFTFSKQKKISWNKIGKELFGNIREKFHIPSKFNVVIYKLG